MESILSGKRWRKLKPGMDLYVQGLEDEPRLPDTNMETQPSDTASVSPSGR